MMNFLVFAGVYLQMGYYLANAVRVLGFISPRKGSLDKVSWIGFVVVMLLWPFVLVMLADRIKADREWWKS